MEEADDILDLLIRNHPADEDDVRPLVVELSGHLPVRGEVETRQVRHHGKHPGSHKAELLEIAAVEFRVAERDIAARCIGAELAAAMEALPRQSSMDAGEVFRRRDVVVDKRHSIRQGKRCPRRLRADRKMVE